MYDYPIQGKDGLPLCEKHGKKLEMLKTVIIDREATELSPPDHCRKRYVSKECMRQVTDPDLAYEDQPSIFLVELTTNINTEAITNLHN